jgi:hypothetical protein
MQQLLTSYSSCLPLMQVQTLVVGITDPSTYPSVPLGNTPSAAAAAAGLLAVRAGIKLPLPGSFFRPLQLLVAMQAAGQAYAPVTLQHVARRWGSCPGTAGTASCSFVMFLHNLLMLLLPHTDMQRAFGQNQNKVAPQLKQDGFRISACCVTSFPVPAGLLL